jgi:hypothetical protein
MLTVPLAPNTDQLEDHVHSLPRGLLTGGSRVIPIVKQSPLGVLIADANEVAPVAPEKGLNGVARARAADAALVKPTDPSILGVEVEGLLAGSQQQRGPSMVARPRVGATCTVRCTAGER